VLAHMRERIEHINRALLEDPSAFNRKVQGSNPRSGANSPSDVEPGYCGVNARGPNIWSPVTTPCKNPEWIRTPASRVSS
jgi:hypothetical protein